MNVEVSSYWIASFVVFVAGLFLTAMAADYDQIMDRPARRLGRWVFLGTCVAVFLIWIRYGVEIRWSHP